MILQENAFWNKLLMPQSHVPTFTAVTVGLRPPKTAGLGSILLGAMWSEGSSSSSENEEELEDKELLEREG